MPNACTCEHCGYTKEVASHYELFKESIKAAAKRYYYRNRDDPEFKARRHQQYLRRKAKLMGNWDIKADALPPKP